MIQCESVSSVCFFLDMWIYILLFVIALVYYAASNERTERNKLPLAIYLAGLALFVGCADMLGGYDRYIYCEVFDQLAQVTRNDGNILATAGYRLYSTEWGFLLFNQLIGYLTLNRYVFIFIVTCVIYTLLFISIKRYCRNYPFAVIVFLGLWFFFTFTYLRQVMAATIGWLAIKYVIDRKPIQFFLIVFIAFTFHNSAIVLAPFYFVPAKKFDPVFVFFILIGSLAIGMTNVLGSIVGATDAFMDEMRVQGQVEAIQEGTFRVAYFIEAALFAGLCKAKGDFIAVMDADLQDPPSLLPKMLLAIETEGFDCAATRRVTRKNEPPVRSFFARLFYKIMGNLSDIPVMDGARDFRLMTRKYKNAVLSLVERNRFTKGIFPWVGFKTKWFSYENIERAAGKTKWSFWKLFLYSIDGIIGFSTKPLAFSAVAGVLAIFVSIVLVALIAIRRLVFGDRVQGWASTVCIIVFLSGVQLSSAGIIGLYISKIYTEVKQRPIYIVKEEK